MGNEAYLWVLFYLLTLILKQEDSFSDLLQWCTFSLLSPTHFLLWQPHSPSVSIAIRGFGRSCSFDQSFVSMKYDTGWALLFHLITLAQTQHGANPATQGADGSRSNTPFVCSVREIVCLKSFVFSLCFFFWSVRLRDWTDERKAYATNGGKNNPECEFWWWGQWEIGGAFRGFFLFFVFFFNASQKGVDGVWFRRGSFLSLWRWVKDNYVHRTKTICSKNE